MFKKSFVWVMILLVLALGILSGCNQTATQGENKQPITNTNVAQTDQKNIVTDPGWIQLNEEKINSKKSSSES
ncbi:hypothetical protein [Desulfosporosinus metallidurans]|uniref:Uncharacterized protein n=1 Tax=Desulfosporosinus metallidurans TaxID=1888891 RepID=A0A1Q8QBQ2_9FIRM|nr:hypothetical protein [Desulfosporosinus metallidurans]OLN24769.1 hypothetical protein DSOL_5405 [Desulfosporosinus metallidurans]